VIAGFTELRRIAVRPHFLDFADQLAVLCYRPFWLDFEFAWSVERSCHRQRALEYVIWYRPHDAEHMLNEQPSSSPVSQSLHSPMLTSCSYDLDEWRLFWEGELSSHDAPERYWAYLRFFELHVSRRFIVMPIDTAGSFYQLYIGAGTSVPHCHRSLCRRSFEDV
jgi:hypothetical protein